MTYYTMLHAYSLFELLYNMYMVVQTWYTNPDSNLSDEGALEHILNYGTWDQVQDFIQAHGRNYAAELFQKLDSKRRNNLKPLISHYFRLYFSHAP